MPKFANDSFLKLLLKQISKRFANLVDFQNSIQDRRVGEVYTISSLYIRNSNLHRENKDKTVFLEIFV